MTEKQEFIDEVEEVETDPKKEHTISLLDLLQLELQEYMRNALKLKKIMGEAKTDYKKKYYGKKLKKNNMEALKILTAIQRVRNNNHIQEEARVEEIQNETDK